MAPTVLIVLIVLIALTVLIALIALTVLGGLIALTDDAPIPPMNLTGMMKNAKTMNHGLSMQATSTALPMSNKNACR